MTRISISYVKTRRCIVDFDESAKRGLGCRSIAINLFPQGNHEFMLNGRKYAVRVFLRSAGLRDWNYIIVVVLPRATMQTFVWRVVQHNHAPWHAGCVVSSTTFRDV